LNIRIPAIKGSEPLNRRFKGSDPLIAFGS
jgi:hypothetical protein